ncbi:hypothetical protein F5X68DRAFT_16546 [Plectosphaerella plurivora]|uniref:Uncharacterized protein n=1 Tax=Plectosphaerella plurivora TaxID=936078 RepID=A0A9P8VAQ4_9PEZI|nr:hypothetical protein F5X68DRAFT_16546 [Plectosphaerella plurivora]
MTAQRPSLTDPKPPWRFWHLVFHVSQAQVILRVSNRLTDPRQCSLPPRFRIVGHHDETANRLRTTSATPLSSEKPLRHTVLRARLATKTARPSSRGSRSGPRGPPATRRRAALESRAPLPGRAAGSPDRRSRENRLKLKASREGEGRKLPERGVASIENRAGGSLGRTHMKGR